MEPLVQLVQVVLEALQELQEPLVLPDLQAQVVKQDLRVPLVLEEQDQLVLQVL